MKQSMKHVETQLGLHIGSCVENEYTGDGLKFGNAQSCASATVRKKLSQKEFNTALATWKRLASHLKTFSYKAFSWGRTV